MNAMAPMRRDLHGLMAAAVERLLPGLDGGFGPPFADWIRPGVVNDAPLGRLFHAIAEQNPEAGLAYWTVRSWTWLAWQPVTVALIAVHTASVAPPIAAMSQRVIVGEVRGFRLPRRGLKTGRSEDVIRYAGEQIRLLADQLLSDLRRIAPMKEKIALRLLADRLLGTLVRLSPHAEVAAIERLAAAWLSATRLEGMSDLQRIRLGDGRIRLVLQRKACCLDYLRRGGGLCSSCPRLPHSERLRRARESENA